MARQEPCSLRGVDQAPALKHVVLEMDSVSMAQMLAKIGCGFAVACFGLDAFEIVYVLPTIVDNGRDAGRYVGCLSDPPMNEQALLPRVPRAIRSRLYRAAATSHATSDWSRRWPFPSM
jgi:hypothetical protein